MTVTTWMENRSCGHRRCCSATDKENRKLRPLRDGPQQQAGITSDSEVGARASA
jgi:hypothetical protein